LRVCIVYEHCLFAHGIERLLARQKSLRMVALIERPKLSPGALKRLRPDVVVMEGNGGMAVLSSIEGLTGVALSLEGEAATLFTGSPIRVSGPKQLAEAIEAVARKKWRADARRAMA
jgi:chemotaxis response regulator CheB